MQTMMVKRSKRPAMEIEASYGLHPPEQWMGAVLRLGWEGSGMRHERQIVLFHAVSEIIWCSSCRIL